MDNDQRNSLIKLLRSTGVTDPDEQTYAVALVESMRDKVIPLVGKRFHTLLEIARKNGETQKKTQFANFGLSTKMDITNIHTLKADYSLTCTESFKDTDGETLELQTLPLPGFDDTKGEGLESEPIAVAKKTVKRKPKKQ